MRDVASTAGVSLKTVSRVVNGEAGVKSDTAARVEAAIARLGFSRNDVARSLRHGRANALGLVIEDVANPFYSAIARTVEDAAHARSHILITGSCEEDAERERELVLRLLRRSVDALLMVLLGGVQTMSGPIVGALTYVGLYDLLLQAGTLWRLELGVAIIALVLAFPEGMAGAAQRAWTRLRPA